MKIARVKLYPIVIPRRTGILNQHIIVRVDTDDDYVGWGEMSDLSHLPLFQIDIPNLEQSLNALLHGYDPRNIAQIEQLMDRYYPFEGHKYSRSGLVRESIDLALHDLLGRVDGVSVSTLLGGAVRDRFKVCYPIFRMRSEADIEPNLERVEESLSRGFDLIRVYVGANVDADAEFLAQFAKRFNGRVKIKSLDFSNLLDWRRSFAAVERFAKLVDFMMLESIALDDDYDGMREFRRRSPYPISEHVHHLHHAWHMVSGDCVDILNVSPYVIGGIRACLRVIALAESSRTSVLIGTTQELNLGTAAVAHLGAVCRVLDYPSDNTGPELYTADVVKQPLRYENGYLRVPDGVGLGVEVDETLLAERTTTITNTFGTNLAGLLDRTAPTT